VSDSESIPRWPAVCQLVRLPNVFTAMADVAMGYLFVTLGPPDWLLFLLLLAASSCLYMAGMVLNDLFDVEQDTRERPQRPIPSGAISLATAQQIGWGLLAGGLVLAGCASGVAMRSTDLWWRSGLIAILLAATIVLYDAVVKPTLAGPLAMGLCRMLNVLLGMSVARGAALNQQAILSFDPSELAVAGGMGLFVVGVTWFARREAGVISRNELFGGIVLMCCGLLLLVALPNTGAFARGERALTLNPPVVWPLLIFVLGFSIVRRCLTALTDPTPARVQLAVKQCILSIVVLDAAICLAVRSPVWWAVGIVMLLVPTLFLGRWIEST
jgi:4-hydroxybenzoate polyprenyltransferase